MWPDVRKINSLNVSKSCPNSNHSRFYLKVILFNTAQLVAKYFELLLHGIFLPRTFKNRPIWSHCSQLSFCTNLLGRQPRHFSGSPSVVELKYHSFSFWNFWKKFFCFKPYIWPKRDFVTDRFCIFRTPSSKRWKSLISNALISPP